MKPFKFVLRTVNVVVLLVLACVGIVSFKKEVTVHLAFNYGITKTESGICNYKEKLLDLKFACGGVQSIWVPHVYMSSSDKPSLVEWKFNFYSFPEYPIEHPSDSDYGGQRSFLDLRYPVRDLFGLGFQYCDVWVQEFKNEVLIHSYLMTLTIVFPIAVLLLPWMLFTCIANRRRYLNWRKEKRTSRGHCGFCDYDLRCEQKVCPECGQTAAIG